MNLDEITDVDKLKALAYDQLAAIEVAQANLRALETRLAQLAQPSDGGQS